MSFSKIILLSAINLLLVACFDSTGSSDDREVSTPDTELTYQNTRPFDIERNQNKYDGDAPAIHIAQNLGINIPTPSNSSFEEMYKIDATAVSLGGSCYRKPKNLARSKLKDWGMKRGVEVKLNAKVFSKDLYSTQRAQWHNTVVISSNKYHLDPNLVHAIITQESNYREKAFNRSSQAAGLMQIIPVTQKELGLKPNEVFIGSKNIDAGSRYFKQLMKTFNNNVAFALAGYNSGPGNVQWCDYKIPPFEETHGYIRNIIGYANLYQKHPTPTPLPTTSTKKSPSYVE